MTAAPNVRQSVAVADPGTPENVVKPNADGSINVMGGGSTPSGFVGLAGSPAYNTTAALVTTSGAYSENDYVGGLITLADAARVDGGTVMIQNVSVQVKSDQTGALTLLVFRADPTATTIADNGALAINAADIFKVAYAIPITEVRDLGTGCVYNSGGLALMVTPATGQDLYAVLVTDTAWTLASIADASVSINAFQVN
jgi:hypothetical protein